MLLKIWMIISAVIIFGGGGWVLIWKIAEMPKLSLDEIFIVLGVLVALVAVVGFLFLPFWLFAQIKRRG